MVFIKKIEMRNAEQIKLPIAPSPGMGSIVEDTHTTFRVWAPHADEVYVIGDFNDWNEYSFPLEKEENGYWAGTSELAKEGHQYKYHIKNGKDSFHRNDPYAFEVTNSDGNSIIRKMEFDWEDDNYTLPAWNSLVIYELHVGTFFQKTSRTGGHF